MVASHKTYLFLECFSQQSCQFFWEQTPRRHGLHYATQQSRLRVTYNDCFLRNLTYRSIDRSVDRWSWIVIKFSASQQNFALCSSHLRFSAFSPWSSLQQTACALNVCLCVCACACAGTSKEPTLNTIYNIHWLVKSLASSKCAWKFVTLSTSFSFVLCACVVIQTMRSSRRLATNQPSSTGLPVLAAGDRVASITEFKFNSSTCTWTSLPLFAPQFWSF